MKVLHLISGGDTGGAKTHIISLLKGLNKLMDAKVICFIEDSFYEDAKNAGISIEVYKQTNRMDMSVIKQLVAEIATEQYDIIHCHGARANFIAMFLKSKVKKPFVTTIHSDYKLDFKDNFYKRLVFTNLNKMALKVFHYYIAISDTFRDMLVDRGFQKDKIFVSYNGIDFEDEAKITYDKNFLEQYKIDKQDKILVGIVARLDLVKDHATFLKAAKEVISERGDILFLLAGVGNDEKRLKAMATDLGLDQNVFFLGFVEDTASFYNEIDINVLTSVSESFPYVILEGARQRKPVISTDVGGIHQLVRDGHNGYLVDVGDYKALASRILELAKDPTNIQKLGNQLYDDVKNRYSTNAMAKKHIEIYEEIQSQVEVVR